MPGRPKTRAKRALQAKIAEAIAAAPEGSYNPQATWEQSREAFSRENGQRIVIRDEFPPPFHRPTEKQRDFWNMANIDGIEEVMFDGAIRSGKTQAACKLIAAWAWKYGGPNWKFVVMRRTYRQLEDSTKAAFLRGDGKMPPACPPALIRTYRAAHETAVLLNGSEILFRSAEDPGKTEDNLRNVTIAGFFIDQVEELTGDDYFQMYETLISRMSDPRGPRKAILVANPGPEDHWAYKRFVDDRYRDSYPYCGRVHVRLDENSWNLPQQYVTSMNRREETNNQWFRRFVLGEWGAFGGKRFQSWDQGRHVVDAFPVPHDWEVVVGIDYGWSNPTAAIICAIDHEGRWWVIGEHFDNEKPVSWHARAIKTKLDELGVTPSAFYLDPSTWARRSEYESVGAEFSDYGIDCAKAQNERLGGWNRIDEMLGNDMDDGKPKLQIFSSCTNLIRELPNLKIKDGTDDIEKENDHAADALRYAIMTRMPHPEKIEEEIDPFVDRRAYLVNKIVEKAHRGHNTSWAGMTPFS